MNYLASDQMMAPPWEEQKPLPKFPANTQQRASVNFQGKTESKTQAGQLRMTRRHVALSKQILNLKSQEQKIELTNRNPARQSKNVQNIPEPLGYGY